MCRWRVVTGLTMVTALWMLTGSSVDAAPVQPAAIRQVGSVQLKACDAIDYGGSAAWCGHLSRPWDTNHPDLGSLDIAFALVLPKSDAPTKPALVAMEGGPGYGSIASGNSFAQMFGPLLTDRAMLVMDARGTGDSAAADCPGIQEGTTSYPTGVRRCAADLGDRATLMGSAMAADDLAAIIHALDLGPVDAYGDSYGTFLAQVFASRHPDLTRSLILDGAYPVTGETAWFPTQGPAMRSAFDAVCIRSPACASRGGTTMGRLATLLKRVRARPLTVTAPGDDSRRHRVVIDAPALVEVAFGGTYTDTTYREFDAAIRAAMAGYALPLGRLVAEAQYPGGPVEDPRDFSAGQFVAVSCTDYPQLFDMNASEMARRAQYQAAIVDAQTNTPTMYAPFGIKEYLRSNWASQADCLTWPNAQSLPGGALPDVPALVLTGDLDTITTPAEGEMVAKQFASARHVVIANATHVTAMGAPGSCAEALVRTFVGEPKAVVAGAGSECAGERPPIPLVTSFSRGVGGLSSDQAARLTVMDVIDRVNSSATDHGLGLTSGTWRYAYGSGKLANDVILELNHVSLYEGFPVNGRVVWNPVTNRAFANVRTPEGTLNREWNVRK